jgi:hypothetical protein
VLYCDNLKPGKSYLVIKNNGSLLLKKKKEKRTREEGTEPVELQ